jgi:hypothetical protein
MSKLFGYIQKTANFKALADADCIQYRSGKVFICASGKPQSVRSFEHPHEPSSRVFVLGNPILLDKGEYRYPEPSDWAVVLADESLLRSLDGHWLVLIAAPEGVNAFNDALGQLNLYIHEDQDSIFFCNSLNLLREHRHPELDYYRFGAYWHSMFPFSRRKYAPTTASYYQGVYSLGTGGKAVLGSSGIQVQQSLWTPSKVAHDAEQLLGSITLLPFKAGLDVTIGLTGGMDIRPLLAIVLGAGYKPRTVHFGSDSSVDFLLARRIAARFGLPFRLISYREAGTSWQQVRDYVGSRGIPFNPVSFDFQGYYPILGSESETFISGYFGELFRFRFMVAHLKSALETAPLDYRNIGRYLFNDPPLLFIPEVTRILHKGFWEALREAVMQMPDSREMLNPLWMNLFFVRYSPQCRNMPNLTWMDQHLTDLMPFLQSSVISEHWRLGFVKQLNEGVHRGLIRKHCPELAQFPLAVGDTSAAYAYRQYALKLKIWAQHLHKGNPQPNRADLFLHTYRQDILELRRESAVREDPALDLARIDGYLKSYYDGDPGSREAILGFIAYALGK